MLSSFFLVKVAEYQSTRFRAPDWEISFTNRGLNLAAPKRTLHEDTSVQGLCVNTVIWCTVVFKNSDSVSFITNNAVTSVKNAVQCV